jgi:acetylxylan esterase
MIVARASTEAPGQGIIGAVATSVQGMIPGSDSEAVDYPATLQNYNTSEPAGTTAMTKLITEYAARCPNSKIALLGYSQVCSPRFTTSVDIDMVQGAQVVGDVMCGTSEKGFTATQPLDAALSMKSTPQTFQKQVNFLIIVQ